MVVFPSRSTRPSTVSRGGNEVFSPYEACVFFSSLSVGFAATQPCPHRFPTHWQQHHPGDPACFESARPRGLSFHAARLEVGRQVGPSGGIHPTPAERR